GLIRYSAAGHPPMLRAPRRGPDVCEVEKNGLVLGLFPTAEYEELEQPLEADDRLLLYTDGLVEAANASDEQFGLDRVKARMASVRSLSPEEAADALLRDVDAGAGSSAGDE